MTSNSRAIQSIHGLCKAMAVALALQASACAAPRYHVVDLGTEYATSGVDKNGVVMGYAWRQDLFSNVPGLYRNGEWHLMEESSPGQPVAIDVAGDVVTSSSYGTDMLWPRGDHHDGTVVDHKFRGTPLQVSGVNTHQVVVGWAYSDWQRQYRCFRWENGVGKELHSPGNCHTSGINRNGWIAGDGTSPTGRQYEGFIWRKGHFHWFDDHPTTFPTAINDVGHVAGNNFPVGQFNHAFLYDGTQFTDLGVLPDTVESVAVAMNDRDEVVGRSIDQFVDKIFLYTGGQMLELATLADNMRDWSLYQPVGIDAAGDIVGNGLYLGQPHTWMAVRTAE